MKRLGIALLLIPTATWLILFSPYQIFAAAVAAFALLCWYEFAGISTAYGAPLIPWHGALPGLLILFANFGETMVLTVIILGALVAAMRNQEPRDALPATAFFSLGLIYVFGAWRAGLTLHGISRYWLFFAITINWVGDSAAYYVGRAIGRHKLAPRISPGKTWEGSIASAVFSAVYGVFLIRHFLPGASLPVTALLAIAGNFAGQLGDLAESALKRGAGVKDSGRMLPGHGGWLDRLDSSLFSMPTVAVLLRAFGNA